MTINLQRIAFLIGFCALWGVLALIANVPGMPDPNPEMQPGFMKLANSMSAWMLSSPWVPLVAVTFLLGPGWAIGFAIVVALNVSYGHFVLGQSFSEPWRWAFLRDSSNGKQGIGLWIHEFIMYSRVLAVLVGVVLVFLVVAVLRKSG